MPTDTWSDDEDQRALKNRVKESITLPQEKWSDEELVALDDPPKGEDIPDTEDLSGAEKIGEHRYVIRTGDSND